jgi:hypothetical protein
MTRHASEGQLSSMNKPMERRVLTLRQLHPTVEQRDATIGFGAVELGLQTMQKLAHNLGVA